MAEYLRFHVRLLDVPGDLWRRFLIGSKGTFGDLHRGIQDACGWENYHLFVFRTPDRREVIAGVPIDDWGEPDPDAEEIALASVFGPNAPQSCSYQYDFGDDWFHEITFEGIEKHPGQLERRLLDGAGTFPPEDCGGCHGYARVLAAVTGTGWSSQFGDESARDELLDWVGDWRPGSFDLGEAKKRFDC